MPAEPRARRRPRAGDDSGQALVEFALVLPLLLLLVLGVMEFGRAINYWINTTHLANQGARFAAVDKDLPGGYAAYLSGQGTTKALREGSDSSSKLAVAICFPEGSSKVGDPVRVVVSTQHNWLPFLGLDAVSTTLKGSATMRIEVPPSAYSGASSCPA